jgi:hypothetical protein
MERINEQLKRNHIQAPKQTTYINLPHGLITKAVEDFFKKLSDFENKLSYTKGSTGADLQIINRNLQRLKIIIEAQPKQVIHEKTDTAFSGDL